MTQKYAIEWLNDILFIHLSFDGLRASVHLWWVSRVALVVKKPPASTRNIKDKGSIPGSGRSPGEGHGNPLQYSCLENPKDRGAWWATVNGVPKSWRDWRDLACTHARHLLGVVNTAVKNNCVEVMFEYLFLFLWCISVSVIARLYSNSGLPWWLRQ